ncbi:MAG: hypothetical protein R3F19_20505 [Verrucomicrobiales bacterium]
MMALLLEAKKLKDRELSGGRTIGPKTLKRLHERYVEILEAGYAINPEPERRPGQRRSAQAWQAAQPAHASGCAATK